MDNSTILTKPHYQILDALGGVAVIIVVFFQLAGLLASSHLNKPVQAWL